MPASKLEALILIKTEPGKTKKLIEYLAEEDNEKSGEYREKAIRDVYEASGKYDVIAHVATKSAKQLFELIEKIRIWPKENRRKPTVRTANDNSNTGVSEIDTILLVHKAMGDP
ncbi:MAG TPA: hypothetical protein VJN71_04875 [Nitrososphaerales archaeon]|nr:hypothetical protein [Nitrososphaerales archaeon]